MAAASSKSSISHVPETKYDVFISFRGKDIRDSFLSHLLKELQRNQIDVYVDKRLEGGDEISSLVQAIEESSISLVIFSENYASSRWCMQELLKILECMEQHQRIVIPIFYKVEPSDVRQQKGSFAEAFRELQEKLEENVVKDWGSALKKAVSLYGHPSENFEENVVMDESSALEKTANLSGFHYPSQEYKNESEFIEKIVKDVSEKLCHIFSSEIKGLVGIDRQIESIESLLAVESEEVQMLGIWGMGGIGKTAIAKVIFKKYFTNYQGSCFLEDVREESEKQGGLRYLFKRLASELLQEKNFPLEELSEKQIDYVKRRLSRIKVFLVLDDVNSPQQLEHLIGEPIHLGPGSRVIITTRDKHILKKEHQVHEVKMLDFENSMQLFCLNAFSKNHPKEGYEKQSEMAVQYAKGIPLALKVLGSSLHSRSIEVWESKLEKIKMHPPEDIVDVLRWSYDKLNDSDKDIFLDIAFFFKGKKKDEVISILRACGFHPVDGIDNLEGKALITISLDNKIEMHHLNEQMGWHLVLQHDIKNPAKRSRLRNPKEVYDVLKNNTGSNKIEGIVFDLSQNNKDLHLHADTFQKMRRLRILKVVYASLDNERSSNVHMHAKLESFSGELRYLEWDEYPSESLPSSLWVENLVELHMRRCRVSELPKELRSLTSLEKLNLSKCKDIIKLPKQLCSLISLKELDLSGCIKLIQLPFNIKALTRLATLRIDDCSRLQSLAELPSSITALYAGNCTSLQSFSFKNCTRLDEHSLNGFMEVVYDTLMRCAIGDILQRQPIHKEVDICYPGSKVPEWFKYKTTEASISLQLNKPHHLFGFFLCFVLPELPSGAIKCQCYMGDGESGRFRIPLVEICDSLNSVHVYTWYHYGNDILDAIKKYRAVDHCTTHGQKISLKLTIKRPRNEVEEDEVEEDVHRVDAMVKGCGVHPIYFSNIRNFIQKFDDKYKECRQLVLNTLEKVEQGRSLSHITAYSSCPYEGVSADAYSG